MRVTNSEVKMPKYLVTLPYTTGTWARLLERMGDRKAAIAALLATVDGTVESLYWTVSTRAAVGIVNLPDAVSASAAATALTKTGAFKDIEIEELLTQEQLADVLTLARDAGRTYQVPGTLPQD